MMERKRLKTDMIHRYDMRRREFIKVTSAFIGGWIGVTIGVPMIAYLLSPELRKAEGGSIVDLGPFENYPIGILTLFEFTQTKING
jgi:hypothetical protein